MPDIDKNSEIDLSELVKKLWVKKRFILKWSLLGLVIGTIIAFSIPKKYTTTVILTTDSKTSLNGSMGMLASMAGINLGSNLDGNTFSPELYPDILNSTPFIQGLFNINVIDNKENINTTLYNYINNEQKVAWWSYIFKIPKALGGLISSKEDTQIDSLKNNSRVITKEELEVIKTLQSAFIISTDKKTGISTVEVTMQSPQISAYLADTLTSYLQEYIIKQRTQKARTDLNNAEELYEVAKINYYKAQENLATFTDKNLNVISAKFKIHQDRLQNEANLAYNVYTQMAQQVQMNKIKVQDNTPVFTIIQPAVEPFTPDKPNKKIIIISFTLLAFAGACFWLLKKDIYNITNSTENGNRTDITS